MLLEELTLQSSETHFKRMNELETEVWCLGIILNVLTPHKHLLQQTGRHFLAFAITEGRGSAVERIGLSPGLEKQYSNWQ